MTKFIFIFLLSCGSLVAGENTMPVRVDNSRQKEFPSILNQIGNSCSQQASIYYILGYDLNQHRQTDGKLRQNQLAAYHTWNYVNRGLDQGSEFGDGWAIAKYLGVMNLGDYGPQTESQIGTWVSGYDKYYRAMQNRVESWKYVDLTTKEGFKTAKNWLVNRGDSSGKGGLLAVDFQLKDVKVAEIPEGEPGAGKKIIQRWGREGGGHLMTYVGYDDTIGYDYNKDGKITNDIDITGDGKVDMADWERGCFILANSWGDEWGNDGFIYTPYREHFVSGWDRGKWVGIMKAKKDYQPRAAIRLKMECSKRNQLKIKWGTATESNAKGPENYSYCPLFRKAPLQNETQKVSPEKFVLYTKDDFPTGAWPLRGPKDSRPIEMGFDLTSVIGSYKKAKGSKFFIDFGIDELNKEKVNGNVLEASILFYNENGEVVKTIPLITKKTEIGASTVHSVVIH